MKNKLGERMTAGNSQNSHFHDRAVMVTGGSGFVGRRLVSILSQLDQPVVSMYHLRLPEPLKNVYPVCSDLNSVDLLAAPLRGVETVVSLAWEESIVGSQEAIRFDKDFRNISKNLNCLANLLEAMEQAKTKRIIFVSAVGANRRAKSQFLREKYLAEVLVLNSKVPEKIIIRSSLVFQPNLDKDNFIRTVMNLMKFPGLYPVPSSDQKFSPIFLDDLCKGITKLITTPLSQSANIIEMLGGEELKVEDIFKIVSERYSKGGRLQVRGTLGNSLVPVFERRGSYYRPTGPKIRDYLSLGCNRDKGTMKDNPLADKVSLENKSFRELLRTMQSESSHPKS